jgi:hypothetical protein
VARGRVYVRRPVGLHVPPRDDDAYTTLEGEVLVRVMDDGQLWEYRCRRCDTTTGLTVTGLWQGHDNVSPLCPACQAQSDAWRKAGLCEACGVASPTYVDRRGRISCAEHLSTPVGATPYRGVELVQPDGCICDCCACEECGQCAACRRLANQVGWYSCPLGWFRWPPTRPDKEV